MKEIVIKTGMCSVGLIFIGLVVFTLFSQARSATASTFSEVSDYSATTTAANTVYGAFTSSRLIKTGFGSFGSVVITGANTATINIYNATTSDITKRAASMASSTILLASIPGSAAAGTYTFDVGYTIGLYVDIASALNAPTSTITYR